jgi:WD40 repeat protein
MLMLTRTLYLSGVLLSVLLLGSCGGEEGSVALNQQLLKESVHGLGLYVIDVQRGWGQTRFFDGRLESFSVKQPAGPVAVQALPNGFATSKGGHVVMHPWHDPEERSRLSLIPAVLSLSPDNKRFAFLGTPVDSTNSDNREGVFVGDFESLLVRRLAGYPQADGQDLNNNPRPTLSWDPTGTQLLYSENGRIVLFDLGQQSSRMLEQGWSAQWSPNSPWISYVDKEKRACLLNLSTGERKTVRAGHKMLGTPLEWSPNGEYLLLAERRPPLPFTSYGHLVVFRVADGAAAFVEDYGVSEWTAHWFQR